MANRLVVRLVGRRADLTAGHWVVKKVAHSVLSWADRKVEMMA